EYCQSCGQAGIGKDAGELWEEHHDQGLDLVLRLLLPHRLSLRMQTDHLPIGGHSFAGDRASSCLPAQERVFRSSWRQADRFSLVIPAARETDAFAADATDGACSRAAPTRESDSLASR